ncbi:hypothetical protein NVS89_15105 [Ancylobacter sp. MQZ15Z-1]|uniref:Uncharacterized protein n=1 Tax=Ancylobacter mangrovi TaxID=2972472 RepID=A0A9X2T4S0_9HYPH|nr:hypothetical protein [Ancylobacter mangrovi]MCS0496431.1 hypothetical protein [Ancylobacter mangrovi]
MTSKKTIRGIKPHPAAMPTVTRAAADWKPEPCGLTREQIRAIIIEQIG